MPTDSTKELSWEQTRKIEDLNTRMFALLKGLTAGFEGIVVDVSKIEMEMRNKALYGEGGTAPVSFSHREATERMSRMKEGNMVSKPNIYARLLAGSMRNLLLIQVEDAKPADITVSPGRMANASAKSEQGRYFQEWGCSQKPAPYDSNVMLWGRTRRLSTEETIEFLEGFFGLIAAEEQHRQFFGDMRE